MYRDRRGVAGLLFAAAIILSSLPARADDPITLADDHMIVPVRPNTDVGVGYGELSPGAHLLEITLHGDGYTITQSYWWDNSGEHIWAPDSINEAKADHDYAAAGVLSNEAHAVRFRGYLTKSGAGGGDGVGPPPEFNVVVNDIKIFMDSDNDATDAERTPSMSSEEHEAGYVGGSSPLEGATGMGMSTGSGWAMIKIQANIKKSCRLVLAVPDMYLSLTSPQWLFADKLENGTFNPRTPYAAAAGSPEADEGCGVVIFEQNVSEGQFSRVLYYKPNPAFAAEGDEIVFTALGAVPGASAAAPKPADRSLATNEDWTLGGDRDLTVIVDAAGVYEDAENPAVMKKLCVWPPSYLPEGYQFCLKRTHPAGEVSKLRVFHLDQVDMQELVFTDDFSDVITVRKSGGAALCETFFLKGLPVTEASGDDPWEAAPDSASEDCEDQGIEIYLCQVGNLQATGKVKNATVVWVTLTILSGDNLNVSGDNPSKRYYAYAYKYEDPKTHLGAMGNGQTDDGPRWISGGLLQAVEICGQLKPTAYSARFAWQRRLISGADWRLDPGEGKIPVGTFYGTMDDSPTGGPYTSDIPTTGQTKGRIYDTDQPGYKAVTVMFWCKFSKYKKDTIWRQRNNFLQWVLLGGERCSEKKPWFVRISRQKLADDVAAFQSTGGANENVGRRGETKLGYNTDTDADPACSLRVVRPGEYQKDVMDGVFEATRTGAGASPYTFRWNLGGTFKNDAPDNLPTHQQTQRLEATEKNHGEHKIFVSILDNNNIDVLGILMVFTNKTPLPTIDQYGVKGRALFFEGSATDPEDGTLSDDKGKNSWKIMEYNAQEQPINTRNETGLNKRKEITLTADTKYVDIILEVVDTKGRFDQAMRSVQTP